MGAILLKFWRKKYSETVGNISLKRNFFAIDANLIELWTREK